MAKRETIAKLFAAPTGAHSDPTALMQEGDKGAVAPPLPPVRERAVRGRFALSEREPVAAYQVSPQELMSLMPPGAPLDRTGDLQALVTRNAVNAMREQALRRFGRRGADR
jgi:hypothetical protein